MRIALGVEYDGCPFLGWQTQSGGGAVQDALEAALTSIAGEPIATTCAGRTDRGVHARGQVVHFDTQVERPDTAWVRGVNALLPSAVAVRWSKRMPENFSARYSAVARTYRYVILNRSVRPAIDAQQVGWWHVPLDVEAMHSAAQAWIGTHDFSAFRSSQCQSKTPIRTLARCDVTRSGERVIFTLTANAFLHHMVRNLVGALVYIGSGREPITWAAHLLEQRERSRAAPTFSAAGLTLMRVTYPAEWALPEITDGDAVLPVDSMEFAG